ncbi:class I SAM-dependent methyltransferase [Parasedimentitalea denitrificans]|uniref:class I SAM-dependent methyltransferase n=1 Tax=Parasedimentitalea denitrificans TaxID=2211118 RepID=UPI0014320A64|nr:methyltransferase domain-containing protein [Sedimentitalea sp. CY04]
MKTDLVTKGCILCSGENFSLLAECDRYGFDLNKQICDDCGLVQTYPALSQSFLNEFYENHYRKLYTKSLDVDYAKFSEEQEEKGERFLGFLNTAISGQSLSNFSIIEIGCSSGGILNYLSAHCKAVQGCDLDANAIQFARDTHSLNAEVAHFPSTIPSGPKIFILSHVLEHVPNPKDLLHRIRSAMTPEDYAFVEVPGLNIVADGSYSNDLRSYFHIAHVADYTASTLASMMTSCRFETVTCDETVTGLFKRSENSEGEVVKSPGDSVGNVLKIEKTFRVFGSKKST